ncbi:MAG: transglycosylase SLT domain-containing protein [Tabrizicola sp.]|uniref:transglycosylase SLT domain-containing protein n=1 Tax=Tabrizicola sp. TaxID=2005166 RepID=UPI0027375BB2|nr:transglycosylase SLT domain-containing protein [Tabrizicola sp.]MDP3262491.1 transglycosylase SLT domain-containing protein [Tabrizicola sp.]MDP3648489.1 transglycosylase SLT domain-containing protein [Paracoccaceae bacterium]MDZ4066016.1 transglycosylase SLT domain-containing protein [Tabrizicola sp.]
MSRKTIRVPFLGLIAASVVVLTTIPQARSTTDQAVLCQDAASQAAEESGVPSAVLLAIALVETGRSDGDRQRPWPWAVNLGGKGRWLASKAEAAEYAQAALSSGATNVDLGCFQLNYRWHAENFASLDEMLDPRANARYAADYLSRLYAEAGNWSDAAAAYHSRTPEHAARYLAKFEQTLASLDTGLLPPPVEEPTRRANLFPLLMQGAAGGRGSLVPVSQSRHRLIGGP